ncbi:hypothetical protein PGTUg99_015826 [Puccinia graminis f. sp. tritici]|uniref:Uncharacterized protein n=1 Tax=Puccinia graminis f. sp. tritici TaxID=56615 RepID=A0A5B0S125_PUCGR|nr:hypothetical protein PGTUg99_015826 [Puccinia graminis f. sp. tritici]
MLIKCFSDEGICRLWMSITRTVESPPEPIVFARKVRLRHYVIKVTKLEAIALITTEYNLIQPYPAHPVVGQNSKNVCINLLQSIF